MFGVQAAPESAFEKPILHVKQRAVVQTVVDAGTGHPLQVPGIGFLWNGKAIGPAFGPPRLGEHTAETLRALGVEEGDFKALQDAGVV